nr:cilia- and flagella-associated protein 61 [Labrus bergylta]
MRTVTSASGQEEAVAVRRSESVDAQMIDSLISSQTLQLFGRVNIIHLLEKANLAVTLANEKEEILAHASFFDHPVGDLVDQTLWEPFLQKHFRAEKCTPWNTLFLHLFVSQPDFSAASLKEIMRAVFNAVAELDYICLVSPHVGVLEAALKDTFEPLQRLTDPGPECLALICHRQEHSPRLQIRTARVEDHDDIVPLFAEQTKQLSAERPYYLADLIEAQNEKNHTVVCESGRVTIGFISLTSDVDVKCLNLNFDLREFSGLYKKQQTEDDGPDAQADVEGEEKTTEIQTSDPQQQEETQSTGRVSEKSNAFCIHCFAIDKKYEMRSADCIPYIFNLFPDLDFCIITVPTLSPEFPLLQSFHRVTRLPTSSLQNELYIFHRDELGSVEVRQAVAADQAAVCDLVEGLRLSETLLQDLDFFYETRRDPSGAALQAFVAQVNGQVVGILIIRDEQDIEYIRARYNIESFIYFSHHRYEEHAQILHFVLKPSFQRFSKHLFKEVLRLAHRSCLYLRIYPSDQSQENSCVHHLDWVLDCAVPVRPRRQIIYPLEELGINGPSRRITENQVGTAAAG